MTSGKPLKTDVHFNHDHDYHQVAELEKWNALAGKWFRLHGDNLRPKFLSRWMGLNGSFGPSGRFQREIKKLEKSFYRKCSNKKGRPKHVTLEGGSNEVRTDDAVQGFKISNTTISDAEERHSDDISENIHNSGDRMIHIIRNIEIWVETILNKCPKTEKIVRRWGGSDGSGGFVGKWEREIAKNPIFQEEIEEEDRYFRSQGTGNNRCGIIFNQFGLHGKALYLYDTAADPNNGIDNLGETYFDNDELMSMKPLPGMGN